MVTHDEALLQLHGSMLALHYVAGQLERKAAIVIWKAPPDRRAAVTDCIMHKIETCIDEIAKCSGPTEPEPSTGGQGPKCGPRFHEEFGICVPNY